jgi:hypothetical protein
MRKRTTAFRKKFIRKLGINTKNFGDRYLELVFEEWPLVETGFDFVLTLKVLEDNVLEEEDRCVTILGRADVTQLVDFLQDLRDRPHC